MAGRIKSPPNQSCKMTTRVILHPTLMRRTAWIWFAGFTAWVFDGIVSLRLHSPMHARLAFLVAIVFFTAGMFYRRQER
jgi:hypothetical protein